MHNIITGEIQEFIEILPNGWSIGTGLKCGPKGKKSYFNPETKEIKFFELDKAPIGWRLGRK